MFDRFWRADPSRVRTVGGSGLGLSISLEDARLHGGWLQVWGQPGAGAQFRLTLPLTAGGELTSSPLPLRPGVHPPAGDAGMSRARVAVAAALLLALPGLLHGADDLHRRCRSPRRRRGRPRYVGIEPLPPEPGATPEEIVAVVHRRRGQHAARAPRGPRAPDRRRRRARGPTRPASP